MRNVTLVGYKLLHFLDCRIGARAWVMALILSRWVMKGRAEVNEVFGAEY